MGDMPELYTTAEAARYLHCTERTVRRYIADGLLPTFKLGRKRLISAEALRGFLAEHAGNEGCA